MQALLILALLAILTLSMTLGLALARIARLSDDLMRTRHYVADMNAAKLFYLPKPVDRWYGGHLDGKPYEDGGTA